MKKTFADTKLKASDKARMVGWARARQVNFSVPKRANAKLDFSFLEPPHNLHDAAVWNAYYESGQAFCQHFEDALFAEFPENDMAVLFKYKQARQGGYVDLNLPCGVRNDVLGAVRWYPTVERFRVPNAKLIPRNDAAMNLHENAPLTHAWANMCTHLRKYNDNHDELWGSFNALVSDAAQWGDIFVIVPEEACKQLFFDACPAVRKPATANSKALAAAFKALAIK